MPCALFGRHQGQSSPAERGGVEPQPRDATSRLAAGRTATRASLSKEVVGGLPPAFDVCASVNVNAARVGNEGAVNAHHSPGDDRVTALNPAVRIQLDRESNGALNEQGRATLPTSGRHGTGFGVDLGHAGDVHGSER